MDHKYIYHWIGEGVVRIKFDVGDKETYTVYELDTATHDREITPVKMSPGLVEFDEMMREEVEAEREYRSPKEGLPLKTHTRSYLIYRFYEEKIQVGDDGIMECPGCDGSGEESFMSTDAHQVEPFKRVCSLCDGEGRIRVRDNRSGW